MAILPKNITKTCEIPSAVPVLISHHINWYVPANVINVRTLINR